jgi:hypothetical protein
MTANTQKMRQRRFVFDSVDEAMSAIKGLVKKWMGVSSSFSVGGKVVHQRVLPAGQGFG